MKMTSLEDLFIEQLRDLYDAERQLVKALPKMAKAASSEDLKNAFTSHLAETRGHVERLEQVFDLLGLKARGKACEAMKGLVKEGSEMVEEDAEPAVRDAGLIAAAQRVEHYEIASYGCVRTFARRLGNHEAAQLLEETLNEEKQVDEKLTSIAESDINEEAMQAAD